MNASEAVNDAPFSTNTRAVDVAEYEQLEEAAPRAVASPTVSQSSSPRRLVIASSETNSPTTPVRVNPSTSAHHVSHAIPRATRSASRTAANSATGQT